MKRKIIFISIILFSLKVFAQTWEILDPSFSDGDSCRQIARVAFASKNIGWLYTVYQKEIPNGDFYKKIYKTKDGGLSWDIKRSEFNKDFYIPILISMEPDYFFSFYTKYNHLYSTNVLLSVDGGISWDSSTVINNNDQYGFRYVHFFNNQNGIAFTNYRWFTVDGGYTWEKEGDTVNFPPPSDVYFVNDSLGWLVSGATIYATDGGYIANTTNGGKTWQYQDSITAIMSGVEFIDSLKGFAVGTNLNFSTGFLYKTIDGGKHWQWSQFIGAGVFWDVGFIDDKNGWITGLGKILRTTNGGETWEMQMDGLNSELKKLIILKKEKVAYIFGDDYNDKTHTFLRADLTNITDVKNEPEALPNKYYLANNYPNPFNPTTVIGYHLPVTGHVTLRVFDMLGREMVTLVNEEKQAGKYGVKFDGSGLASGVYFYNLVIGEKVTSGKMILSK